MHAITPPPPLYCYNCIVLVSFRIVLGNVSIVWELTESARRTQTNSSVVTPSIVRLINFVFANTSLYSTRHIWIFVDNLICIVSADSSVCFGIILTAVIDF